MASSSAYDTPDPTDAEAEGWSSDQSFTPSTPSTRARSPSVHRRRPRRSSRHAPLSPLSPQAPRPRRGTMELPSSPLTPPRKARPTTASYRQSRPRRSSYSSQTPNQYPPQMNYNYQQPASPSQPQFYSEKPPLLRNTTDGSSNSNKSFSLTPAAAASFNPVDEINTAATTITGFLREILSNALWLLRKPLAWLVTLYILAVLFSYTYSIMRSAIFSALSPLCLLPGTSHFPFCLPAATLNGKSGTASYNPNAGSTEFPMLMDLQGSFSTVLENSAGGSVMALDLKNSEMAVRDLNALVKASDLLCKEDLSNRLDSFVGAAKSTSRALTRFSSRVNGVVDNLLAMDEYAIRALEEAAKTIGPGGVKSKGLVPDMIDTLLSPFYAPPAANDPRHQILNTFIQASSIMDTSIRRLIFEAETTLRSLEDLESRLETINNIAARESFNLTSVEKDVLASIWTRLGGNRQALANFRDHKELLMGVKRYRATASTHVSASLIMLQNMQANLEELRDRVVAPGLASEEITRGIDEGNGNGEVMLEVHVKSIRKGVERLREGMEKAKGREEEYMRKMLKQHDETLSTMVEERRIMIEDE